MFPSIVTEIAALPGWNAPMLLLLAKATLILIAALGMTVAMQRRSAGARHLVWLATLGIVLLVPAVAAWVPPLKVAILPPAPAATAKQHSAPVTTTHQPVSFIDNAAPVAAPSGQAPEITKSSIIDLSGISLFLAVWAAIAVGLAGWLAFGALSVRRIVRNSHPLDTQDWLTPLWEIADRLELEEPPRLLGSNEAKMPFACGFLKPTIVLPSDCESWSADRRRAVLLHELAHVKRHDLVGHTLGRLACAIYWFHPLVWTAAKQLRNESERACDDLALACGARASDYAEHLLDIVTSVRRDSTPAVALAMARRKEFEGRMLAILDPELRHSTPSRRQSAALIGSLAVMAVLVGAAAPARRPAAGVEVVSSQVPAMDSDFKVDDRPVKSDERPIDRHVDKAIDKAVDKVMDKRTETIVDQHTNTVTNKSVTDVVAEAAANASTEGVRQAGRVLGNVISKDNVNEYISKLGATLGQKVAAKAPDDRAILLANVLRTETDATLRRTAAWGLSEFADQSVAIEALANALRRDSDASVREMAAWALGDGDGKSSIALGALENALRSDASENVRATSAWALGSLGDDDALDALVAGLSSSNKRIKFMSLWAIGSIEPKRVPPAAVAMLRDPNPEVRELAAWVIYSSEDVSTVPALNAALQSETNTDLKLAYIRALASLGEQSVDAVRGLLTSSDPRIKSMAIRALAGGHGAGPWPWPMPMPRPFP
jgi:beta-lactamase regulating signal transducer with metallopeptidase domain/HEAT repeat protein